MGSDLFVSSSVAQYVTSKSVGSAAGASSFTGSGSGSGSGSCSTSGSETGGGEVGLTSSSGSLLYSIASIAWKQIKWAQSKLNKKHRENHEKEMIEIVAGPSNS